MLEKIGAAVRTVDYDYDHLNRLTRETIDPSGANQQISYAPVAGQESSTGYDAVGNRRSRVSAVTGVASTGTAVRFDANDWIDNDTDPATPSIRFDANGNTKIADLDGNGTIDSAEASHIYGYDLENRLVTQDVGDSTVSIVYDGDGNRVQKTVNGTMTKYLTRAALSKCGRQKAISYQ